MVLFDNSGQVLTVSDPVLNKQRQLREGNDHINSRHSYVGPAYVLFDINVRPPCGEEDDALIC